MKVFITCFLLTFLGLSIASPTSSLLNQYQELLNTINGGGASEKSSEKVVTGQLSSRNLYDYLKRYNNGFYKVNKENADEVTSLLESLASVQDNDDSEDGQDMAFMQSLFKVLEKLQMEKAKEMDSTSARAQFLKGLGSALWNAGKNYLTDRYCPKPETPTQYISY